MHTHIYTYAHTNSIYLHFELSELLGHDPGLSLSIQSRPVLSHVHQARLTLRALVQPTHIHALHHHHHLTSTIILTIAPPIPPSSPPPTPPSSPPPSSPLPPSCHTLSTHICTKSSHQHRETHTTLLHECHIHKGAILETFSRDFHNSVFHYSKGQITIAIAHAYALMSL